MNQAGAAPTNRSPQPQDAPIFILGCPRSGTTLLSRILNNHPRIGVPYESQFFSNFYRQIQAYGDLSQPERMLRLLRHMLSSERVRVDWGLQMDENEVMALVRRQGFGGAFEAVMTAWAQKAGKPRWGEKTPQNAHYAGPLVAFFPAAKYLHIIRDGRDVALSLFNTPFGPKSSYHAARYWLSYLDEIETIRRRTAAEQFHLLRYEDLLGSPEKTLQGVCSFLDETYDHRMLAFFRRDTPSNIEETNRANLQRPLDPSNMYKWKRRMSPAQLQIFESLAGERLEQFGYERSGPPAPLPPFAAIKDRFIKPAPARIRGMLVNAKAQREFLFRLRNRIEMLIR